MIDLTPEQQQQIIGIIIIVGGSIATFLGLMLRLIVKWLNVRIETIAKQGDDAREKQRQEFELQFAESQAEARREDRLFELNEKHADAIANVGKALEMMAERQGEGTNQIEVLSTQVGIAVSQSRKTEGKADKAVSEFKLMRDSQDKLSQRIENIFKSIQDEIADALETSSKAHDERLAKSTANYNETLQKIFDEISKARREMSNAKLLHEAQEPTQDIPNDVLDQLNKNEQAKPDNSNNESTETTQEKKSA